MKRLVKEGTSERGVRVEIWEHSENGGYFHITYGQEKGGVGGNLYLPTETPKEPRSYWLKAAEKEFERFLRDDTRP